ncbi:hypothetical protein N9D44_02760, partial [Pontimonas sp.]|nr:hypothetical protein [Pontimonas sp.]
KKFSSVTVLLSSTEVEVFDPTTETLFECDFSELGEIAIHLAPARFGAHQIINRQATDDLGELLGTIKNLLVQQSSAEIKESEAALLCLQLLKTSITNYFDQTYLSLGEAKRLGSRMPSEDYLVSLDCVMRAENREGRPLSSAGKKALSRDELRPYVADLLTADFDSIYPETLGPYLTRLNPPKDIDDPWFWYASEQNVMKLIKPLFLDGFEAELAGGEEEVTNSQTLRAVTRASFLDPTDSPGSFHTATISGLSYLLDKASAGDDKSAASLSVENFVQICSNPEAAEVARFAIWFAFVKHLHRLGLKTPAEVLDDVWGRVDVRVQNQLTALWTINESGVYPDFIYGAPKFLGSNLQSDDEKTSRLGIAPGNYDLCAAWLIKAAQLFRSHELKFAFVLTSSVTKGPQVLSIWSALSKEEVEIFFAWAPFKWSQGSINQSTVSVVILGLQPKNPKNAKVTLFDGSSGIRANFISPHLIPDIDSLLPIQKRPKSSLMPEMKKGVMPYATKSLVLSEDNVAAIGKFGKEYERYVRPFVGGEELLKGVPRHCLWVEDEDLATAIKNPVISQILDEVVVERTNMAQCPDWLISKPNRYRENWQTTTHSLAIPQLSSEDRPYIPIDLFGPEVILSNLVHVVYDAPFWLFSLMSSSLHNLWARTYAGGFETRIRYNIDGIYNTFPFPNRLSHQDQTELAKFGKRILETREETFEIPLGKLYQNLPDRLKDAHNENDDFVCELLGISPKLDERQHLESLLGLKKVEAHD